MSNQDRFWSKVEKSDGCWIWTAYRRPSGHGIIRWDGPLRPASQVALELSGKPRIQGTEACHRCDNPPCVNPAHLYWGTRQDNINDAYARGGRAPGERHASARLTEAEVIEMRTLYAAGSEVPDLAIRYGVAVSTVRCIVLGFKWKTTGGPLTRRRNRKAA